MTCPPTGLALAATLALTPLAAAGSPGLCHPLDIRGAETLPMGEGGPFELDPDFDRRTTVERTLALLDAGDDPLVHMETLRRAVLYLTRDGDEVSEEAEVERLVAALEARLPRGREAGGKTGRPTDAAVLTTFDLGYALGLLSEMGPAPRGRDRPLALLEEAVAARPDDGALRLGAAIVAFGAGERRRSDEHLLAALEAEDPDGLLAANACRTMGPVLGARSRQGLIAVLHDALERA